jgi:thiol-disulfide isomerase/thioredoxin
MKQLLCVAFAFCLLLTAWPGSSGQAPTRMQIVSFDQWADALAGQRGNITVVDYWASWCPPCIERFPRMVEMHHEYSPRGVRFISLNLDEKGDRESIEWANEFLAVTGAVFANYHLDENMTQAFERLDLLGLPTVRVYAADGTEAFKLTGDNPYKQFTEKDVENAILDLLGR